MKNLRYLKFIITACFLILSAKLFMIQIWNHAYYENLSKTYSHITKKKYAIRSSITDRNGKILAYTENLFDIEFEENKNTEILLKNNKIKYKIQNNKILLKKINWQCLKKVLALNQNALNIKTHQIRKYNYISCAHLIGYIKNIEKNESNTGSEKVFYDQLCGQTGKEISIVNAKQQVIKTINLQETCNAQPFNLSIDIDLQEFAFQELNQFKKAALIIVDIETGEILAAVSIPSYDPNDFISNQKEKIQKYLNDENKPLVNLYLQGIYPFGSTIKPFMLLAALKKAEKKIPEFYICNGKYKFGNREFKCSHIHGKIHVSKILSYSCNIPFYSFSEILKKDDIQNIYDEFGFGQPVLQNITKTYAKLNMKNLKKIDILFMQIGQVKALVTLAQLVRAYARLASETKVDLTILKTTAPVQFPKINIKKKHLQFVKESLYNTLNDSRGTMHTKCNMAGKTGTAQVAALTENKKNAEKKWKLRHHTFFCVFAPYDKPKIAGCLIIEHGVSSYHTGTILIKIMEYALKKR